MQARLRAIVFRRSADVDGTDGNAGDEIGERGGEAQRLARDGEKYDRFGQHLGPAFTVARGTRFFPGGHGASGFKGEREQQLLTVQAEVAHGRLPVSQAGEGVLRDGVIEDREILGGRKTRIREELRLGADRGGAFDFASLGRRSDHSEREEFGLAQSEGERRQNIRLVYRIPGETWCIGRT